LVTLSSSKPARGAATSAGAALWSALVLAIQAVVAVVAAGYWAVQIGSGGTDEVARSVVELVLFLLAAAGFVALARGLWRGSRWPRTPTVLWHVLLVPVGISLWQSGEVVLAVLVLLGVTVAIAGIVLSRPHGSGVDA